MSIIGTIRDGVSGILANVKNNVNTTNNELLVNLEGHQCPANTTSLQLNAGGVFTGSAWQDTLDYGVVSINVGSDQNSATDGLDIQWSNDGLTVFDHDKFTILANVNKTFTFGPAQRYYRVVYTNGSGGTTTSFHLTSLLRRTYVKPSSHRITDAIVGEDDAELVKSVLTGVAPDGVFYNVKATPDGDLQVVDNTTGLAIAQGNVAGTTFIHKFGNTPDFDISDGDVTVWDGANDAGINVMQYVYSSSADIDSLSSSSASDTFNCEVQGLNSSYEVVTQTITLTGQTRVALTTNLIRVIRMKNVGSADNVGRIFCFVNVATTGGVPNTVANIRAVIREGNNQTLMSIYTIPAGKTGYMRDWYASMSARKTAAATMKLVARPFGQVFQLKHVSDINSAGSSYIQHQYEEPEVFTEKTDIEMRASTSVDANGVSAGFDLVLVDN